MKKNYEAQLPQGYAPAFVVDAKNKKVAIWLNVVGVLIMIPVLVVSVLLIHPQKLHFSLSSYLLFVGAMVAYIVLHELTHGAAYKLLTRQKLTFGMTLTVAYCGVPNIFVYRRTALIALLAPFVAFLPVFILPMVLLPEDLDRIYCAILLALHVGGCTGDLWDTWLYLTRFRRPETLMQDTGPKQTFYLPE